MSNQPGPSEPPRGKAILDFGQNLVGYLRLTNIRGSPGDKITLAHAEVLESGELGTRPLRNCKATDEYTLKGSDQGEQYEPRFTFHGFRYAQVDGWTSNASLETSIEAVVCHTDMKKSGAFSCSDPLLNQLHQNISWSMRGNFLSIPTDCPQRDESWAGLATWLYLPRQHLSSTIPTESSRTGSLMSSTIKACLEGFRQW